MMMCKVKLAIVVLALVAATVLGDDCDDVSSTTTCTTTPACPADQESTTAKPGKGGALAYLSTNNDCNKLVDGTILLDSRHCRRFYICSNSRAMRNKCDIGYWFDKVKRQCLPRAQVKSCDANRN